MMRTKGFEAFRVYQLEEKLADEIWTIVSSWDYLAKDTVGKQLIKAAVSIGADIAEGSGRGSYPDNLRFFKVAHGFLCEVRHGMRRALCRNLLTDYQINATKPLLKELSPKLNAYLRSIGSPRQNASVE